MYVCVCMYQCAYILKMKVKCVLPYVVCMTWKLQWFKLVKISLNFDIAEETSWDYRIFWHTSRRSIDIIV